MGSAKWSKVISTSGIKMDIKDLIRAEMEAKMLADREAKMKVETSEWYAKIKVETAEWFAKRQAGMADLDPQIQSEITKQSAKMQAEIADQKAKTT